MFDFYFFFFFFLFIFFFFFSSRRRHTRSYGDWSSDVCSSDLLPLPALARGAEAEHRLLQAEGRDAGRSLPVDAGVHRAGSLAAVLQAADRGARGGDVLPLRGSARAADGSQSPAPDGQPARRLHGDPRVAEAGGLRW